MEGNKYLHGTVIRLVQFWIQIVSTIQWNGYMNHEKEEGRFSFYSLFIMNHRMKKKTQYRWKEGIRVVFQYQPESSNCWTSFQIPTFHHTRLPTKAILFTSLFLTE